MCRPLLSLSLLVPLLVVRPALSLSFSSVLFSSFLFSSPLLSSPLLSSLLFSSTSSTHSCGRRNVRHGNLRRPERLYSGARGRRHGGGEPRRERARLEGGRIRRIADRIRRNRERTWFAGKGADIQLLKNRANASRGARLKE